VESLSELNRKARRTTIAKSPYGYWVVRRDRWDIGETFPTGAMAIRAVENELERKRLRRVTRPLRVVYPLDQPKSPKSSKGIARRRQLAERDGSHCHYCRVFLTVPQRTIDHIWPRVKQGPNHDWNFVLACEKCNSDKGDTIYRNHCSFCTTAQRRMEVKLSGDR